MGWVAPWTKEWTDAWVTTFDRPFIDVAQAILWEDGTDILWEDGDYIKWEG